MGAGGKYFENKYVEEGQKIFNFGFGGGVLLWWRINISRGGSNNFGRKMKKIHEQSIKNN